MTVHHFTFHITNKSDASGIREVETRTFDFSKEADLMTPLLENEGARPASSLLARYEGKTVGHILFTRATFKEEVDSPLMHIPAPLAVIPEYQGMDVGGRLICTSIEHLELMGYQTVFVFDRATHYPRHGFRPCVEDKDYPTPYPIPEEHKAYWMMQSPTAQSMTLTGHTRCADPDETGTLA